MNQAEMVQLIAAGVAQPGGTWADLGAGTGNFTWALAECLGPTGRIYAIDRDARAVAAIERRLAENQVAATVMPQQADTTRLPPLPSLDGVLMANLLHFLHNQQAQMARVAALLHPGGTCLLVEYEQQGPIPWVPFPVPFVRFVQLAEQAGFLGIRRIGIRRSPSSGRDMYAAVARTPG